MGETVQHFCIPAEALYGQTVVFLVQEESGLLAVLHIYQVADAVFCDLYFCVKGFADKAFDAFHPFLQPDFGIAAFVDAADVDAVVGKDFFQDRQDRQFQAVDAQGQGLHHQHVGKFIHHQSGEEVRLSEQEPAAAGIAGRLAVVPGRLDAFCEKCLVDHMLFSTGHKADPDLGVGVDEAVAHKIPVKVLDRYQVSVFKIAGDRADLVVIYPQAASFDGAAFSLFQCDGCMVHENPSVFF